MTSWGRHMVKKFAQGSIVYVGYQDNFKSVYFL